MPRGKPSGGRGGHRGGGGGGHKGQRRHFSNPEELEAQREKEERERQWKHQRGQVSDSDSDAEEDDKKNESKSESEESESEDDEAGAKAKGVEALIDIENPNRVVRKNKKISQLDDLEVTKPELSRKEREELEKQQARANYLRLHAAGKTEDARADLARLALIKKQRQDAAKKRDEEKKRNGDIREETAKAKTDSVNKALGKNKAT